MVETVDIKSSHWSIFRWFLLRGTGMPFDWLDASDVGHGTSHTSPWEAARDEQIWCTQLERHRKNLWNLVGVPIFREAIFLSNPALDQIIDRWEPSFLGKRRNSKDRRRERALVLYAQRFCSKNDSTSFFGATSLGLVDGDEADILVEAVPIISVRKVFVEQWIVQRIIEAAVADLASEGNFIEVPRRAANVSIADETTVVRFGQNAAGDYGEVGRFRGRPYVDAVRLANGRQNITELTCSIGSRANEVVDELLRAGVLASCTEIPVGVSHPIATGIGILRQQAPGPTRERWIERLEYLRTEAAAFGECSIDARRKWLQCVEAEVEGWIGEKPRRHAGQYYASRTIIHEVGDRTGGIVALPDDLTSSLRSPELTSYLDFCALPVLVERLRFFAWFENTIGDERVSWNEVGHRLEQDWLSLHLNSPRSASELLAELNATRLELRQQIDEHLSIHGKGVPFHVDHEHLMLRFGRWLPQIGAAYANPDLMFIDRRRSGHGLQMVVGEAHNCPFLAPALFAAAPAMGDAITATNRVLAEVCRPALPALVFRNMTSFMAYKPDFGEIALEQDGTIQLPDERRAALTDLAVELSPEGGLSFTVETYAGQEVEVMPLSYSSGIQRAARVYIVNVLDLADFLASGPDWRSADDLPRLVWGNLVVHRRRFRIPSGVWATGRDTRKAIVALGERYGELPRLCFVSAKSEQKPILIDWSNPISAELALWLANREDELVFSEMLPGPDELWLRSPDGLLTSEIRTVLFRRSHEGLWDE